jgi:hypothetical protein
MPPPQPRQEFSGFLQLLIGSSKKLFLASTGFSFFPLTKGLFK